MKLNLTPDPLPLREDEHGRIWVGGTRVFLDILIDAHQTNGWSAEELVRQFDTLKLADVYAALAYYYRHKAEVDEYIRERDAAADAVQAEMQKKYPPPFTREELMARMAARREAEAHDSAAH